MTEQAIVKEISVDGSCLTLVLHGTFTIENVSELHTACVEAFEAFPVVTLNASDVETMDLTVCRLFVPLVNCCCKEYLIYSCRQLPIV